MGSHKANIPPGDIPLMYKYLFLGEFFTIISIPISKTSFALTLLRLVTKTWHRVFIWLIIITMNVVMWLCAILILVQCQPIAKNWNKSESFGVPYSMHSIVNNLLLKIQI